MVGMSGVLIAEREGGGDDDVVVVVGSGKVMATGFTTGGNGRRDNGLVSPARRRKAGVVVLHGYRRVWWSWWCATSDMDGGCERLIDDFVMVVFAVDAAERRRREWTWIAAEFLEEGEIGLQFYTLGPWAFMVLSIGFKDLF
jgi:hypothetical protein